MAGRSYSPTARKTVAKKRKVYGGKKKSEASKRGVRMVKRDDNGCIVSGPQDRTIKQGRPISGRAQALRELDEMLAKGKNKTVLSKALEVALRDDPVDFFRVIIMPLIPKESLVRLESGERFPVRITLGVAEETKNDLTE